MAAASGRNEGFHILEEFVCEAIPDASLAQTDSRSRGQNEGVRVIGELVHDCSSQASAEGTAPGGIDPVNQPPDSPKSEPQFGPAAPTSSPAFPRPTDENPKP